MSHLLDTCLLSELAKTHPNPGVENYIKTASHSESTSLYISVFSIGEIKRRLNRLPDSKKKQALSSWYTMVLIAYKDKFLDCDLETAKVWADITAEAESKGKTRSYIDSLIAATAIYYELTVVTRNVSDFEHTGVRILNPWT